MSRPRAQSYLAEVEELEAWHKATPSVRRIDILEVEKLEAVAVNYIAHLWEHGDELKTVAQNFRHGMAAHVLRQKLLVEMARKNPDEGTDTGDRQAIRRDGKVAAADAVASPLQVPSGRSPPSKPLRRKRAPFLCTIPV